MDFSIVEYFDQHEGSRCGYCKSKDGSLSRGMWAHCLKVEEYEALINRGWRRSGKYCYKPTMKKTCCPLYTIKCEVLDFKLSKSQKKVLKKMKRFLLHGKKLEDQAEMNDDYDNKEKSCSENLPDLSKTCGASLQDIKPKESSEMVKKPEKILKRENSENSSDCDKNTSKREGLPPCRKAKLIRREKFKKKCLQNGMNAQKAVSQDSNQVKMLEDHIAESASHDSKHSLEIKVVRCSENCHEFQETFDKSYNLYKKYQMCIHNDSEAECDQFTFNNFLVDSPLQEETQVIGSPHGYGSFHMQYWLDGELIAVGVVDILPNVVSSVYFYYDPSYNFLSLGTYSALREIAFTQELNKHSSSLKFYYLGYYNYSCQKLRYKGNYSPSFLLCPETYKWFSTEKCCHKFQDKKYWRLNDNPNDVDEDEKFDFNSTLILHKHQIMPFSRFKNRYNPKATVSDIQEYGKLVGKNLVNSILLYRS